MGRAMQLHGPAQVVPEGQSGTLLGEGSSHRKHHQKKLRITSTT
jgi:hypothetical protein